MEPMKINPFYGAKEGTLPEISYLLPFGDNYAITSDVLFISLVEVIPDPDHAGEFKPKIAYSNIDVAIDDKQTFEGIKEVVQVLRTMTAYELLPKHFNQDWTTFFINRDRTYEAGYEEGESKL